MHPNLSAGSYHLIFVHGCSMFKPSHLRLVQQPGAISAAASRSSMPRADKKFDVTRKSQAMTRETNWPLSR